MIERSAEAEAFFTAIEVTAPELVSACDGWTAHEIAAHVTNAVSANVCPLVGGASAGTCAP